MSIFVANRFVVFVIHVILFILVLVGVYSEGDGELAVWFVVHWVGDGGLPLVGGWPLAVGGWTRVGHSIYLLTYQVDRSCLCSVCECLVL